MQARRIGERRIDTAKRLIGRHFARPVMRAEIERAKTRAREELDSSFRPWIENMIKDELEAHTKSLPWKELFEARDFKESRQSIARRAMEYLETLLADEAKLNAWERKPFLLEFRKRLLGQRAELERAGSEIGERWEAFQVLKERGNTDPRSMKTLGHQLELDKAKADTRLAAARALLKLAGRHLAGIKEERLSRVGAGR